MVKKGYRLSVLIVLIFLASTFVGVFNFDEIETVSGAEAEKADAAGYSWVDSLDPAPKINYEWIDITDTGTAQKENFPNSYGERYRMDPIDYLPLGFDFEFYGETYDEIQVYPNGVLGFGETNYGYAIYNYAPLPNQNSYTPKGAIAPFWVYYGGPLIDGDESDVWTQQGQTEEGMKYWIASWYDINYYYYDDAGATFQAILYENGNIVINIKDTGDELYSTAQSYLTIGIINHERTVATTYSYRSYSSLEDESSVMFKQFKTGIVDSEISPGFGPDEKIYPAMAGKGEFDYFARFNLWCEKGVEKLTEFNVQIRPQSSAAEPITLIYDFDNGRFSKINDGSRQLVFNPDSCSIYYPNPDDMTHYVGVEFRYDFNLWWEYTDSMSLIANLYGDAVKGSSFGIGNAFEVETRVLMAGNLTIKDSNERNVTRGDWVRGGDTLHFTGIHREYSRIGDAVTVPDFMKIVVEDQNAKVYQGEESDLNVYVPVGEKYNNMVYNLAFINVSTENDLTPIELTTPVNVKVDSDLPGLPGQLMVYPDDPEKPPQYYDDDREVYLKWEPSVDSSSGILRYHISINTPQSQARDTETVPAGTESFTLKNLEEGMNKIFIWAEDEVGNIGGQMFANVIIDVTPVTFSEFYPSGDEWLTNQRPTCSVLIDDPLTGVDPLSLEYQVSISGKGGLNNAPWRKVQESYSSENTLRVAVVGWFTNGKDNYIRFRAKDLAGNGYTVSGDFNVWIDSEGPRYSIDESLTGYQRTRTLEVPITIRDGQSGVDSSSIEYRYTTQGKGKFTPWKPYKEAIDGNSIVVKIEETFKRGEQNFIQVRAKDLAGNLMTSSEAFQIKVNTLPIIEILSPKQSDQLYVNQRIVFDATPSYDPDGDEITIRWYSSRDNMENPFSRTPRVQAKDFPVGEHTITVIAEDYNGGREQRTFTITVREETSSGLSEELDKDGDGLPDEWEKKYNTNPDAKDALDDPDQDGFNNLREYENGTHPLRKDSHPFVAQDVKEEDFENLFENWILWLLLAVLLIVIVVTMLVTKSRKDKAVNRIRTVHNMKKIMPSVSWEQIQTTTYMAPGAGAGLPTASQGPALPQAQGADVSPDSALPPAQQAEGGQAAPQAHEAAHVPQQSPGVQAAGAQEQPQVQQQGYQAAPAQQNVNTQQEGNYDPNAPQQ